jgi:hypothetical protein
VIGHVDIAAVDGSIDLELEAVGGHVAEDEIAGGVELDRELGGDVPEGKVGARGGLDLARCHRAAYGDRAVRRDRVGIKHHRRIEIVGTACGGEHRRIGEIDPACRRSGDRSRADVAAREDEEQVARADVSGREAAQGGEADAAGRIDIADRDRGA